MMISLDCETTGVDYKHGSLPFLVTTTNQNDDTTWWEWAINPKTRMPIVPKKDLKAIQGLLDAADKIVLQNSKFDYAVLAELFYWKGVDFNWPWEKIEDTLIAGHLLSSDSPHDLTSMVSRYLLRDISVYEVDVETACKEARDIAKREFPEWRIARAGLKEIPSAKEKVAKYDMWLPRAVAKACDYPEDHPWRTVVSDYANVDSYITFHLWKVQRGLLERKNLLPIYRERIKILPVACGMEGNGVTISEERFHEFRKVLGKSIGECNSRCVKLAGGEEVLPNLPKAGTSNALKTAMFDVLKFPIPYVTETGEPSISKVAIDEWLATENPKGKRYRFVASLSNYRKASTAANYMDSYRRFMTETDHGNWKRLHPAFNPTGTHTLRWSSSNPNAQNLSKQEGFNVRYIFGPMPGREWWSLDYQNQELRIPAYESGEYDLVALFENPNAPPYYGSQHLLNFHTVYPDLWNQEVRLVGLEQAGKSIKKKYASTWYQWCKNGGFAVQYGAMEGSGTADGSFHMPGAHARLKSRFSKLNKLNQWCIDYANRHGYIETLPDKEVDPSRGYPLNCTKTRWGSVLPTVPLNYRVQGTACWVVMRAMIGVQRYLDTLGPEYKIVMNIHDELVLDFPYKRDYGNLPKIRKVRRIMEHMGDCINVPLTVGVEYIQGAWSQGVAV